MKRLPLTKNAFTLVDDEDFQFLSQFKWVITSEGYAKTSANMYLHRMLFGVAGRRYIIDHINGNRLDNQRHNLRSVNQSINLCNTEKGNGISKYRGVYRSANGKKWLAQFRHKHLGCFLSEVEASKIYVAAKTNYLRNLNVSS